MPETFASTLRDMPRSARVVRTRWPSASRKPASDSGVSVMSPFRFRVRHARSEAISFLRQSNFAKTPPIEIARRFQHFGFDECSDAVAYKVHLPAPRQFQRFRDVIDDARNFHESRSATCHDGLIDQNISHRCYGAHFGNIMPERIDSKCARWLSMNYNS